MAKKKSFKEVNDELVEFFEDLTDLLPLSRGGQGARIDPDRVNPPRNDGRLPTSPAPAGDEVRFRPTPAFKPTKLEAIETIVNDDSVVLPPVVVEAINNPAIRMTREGEIVAKLPQEIRGSRTRNQVNFDNLIPNFRPSRKKKPKSKYRKAYEKAFKECQKKHMTKGGKWKKGGFTRCVREAHKMALKRTK